jgi:hypothetical protein
MQLRLPGATFEALRMTFIVVAANNDYAIHVADTLLTKIGGAFYADDAAKSLVVHTANATCALSYTGIACIDNQRTDEWIAAKLNDFDPSKKSLKDVADYLTTSLNEALGRHPSLGIHGLTIPITGLGNLSRGLHEIAIGSISNMETPQPKYNAFTHVDPKGREFRCFVWTPTPGSAPPRYYMAVHGSISQKLNIGGHRRKIIRDLESAKTADDVGAVVNSLVAMLRHQRLDSKISGVVGENCNSIVIDRNRKVTVLFHGPTDAVVRQPIIIG